MSVKNDAAVVPDGHAFNRLGTTLRPLSKQSFSTADRLQSVLKLSNRDVQFGRYQKLLYRFLTDNIPVVNACIWTWVRLSSAPGKFVVSESTSNRMRDRAEDRLHQLSDRVKVNVNGSPAGLMAFMVELFTYLYRDGVFGGFLTVRQDGSGIDQFVVVDPLNLGIQDDDTKIRLVLEHDTGHLSLDRPDFFYIPLHSDSSEPLGRSILKTVSFIAYVEQQLVDDMRRASHNSGFHRLHVKITPPVRMSGESDSAYVERINGYFDATVSMIKSCEVDDNPVTWDNVAIEHIGPENIRSVTNSWFISHRSMIEDICAGTNLAPFMLGYSYGATTTWAGFKFDIVMRQVHSIQQEVAHFMEWMGNIELALAGIDAQCRFSFDNSFAYQAAEDASVTATRIDNVLKLLNAGLIDQETARKQAGDLL